MDLQISVFLLFILFTAGHSLRCYECNGLTGSCVGQTVQTCPSGYSQCESLTGVTQIGDITSKEKFKGCAPVCRSGSINFGLVRMTTSCCNTDLCNLQDAPDPSNVPNGKKCYYCDGQTCSKTLSCSGDEDRCITATATSGGQTVVVKGCVSKSFCDATTSVRNVESISCCEGNLCNGAQSVSQSFLFFCCSLLSYFLLH
ncbi:prostate stem cell antigen-like [Ctenopharyngodon idella]|uniref:prostate stem cell antigen-like n=1 Tax=Ctenopharyngodon idella TaxID=7959 RepID=UPI00222E2B07|nr:prostate stem cell antigen-like [Ctenopharyngodon idella]